MLRIVLLIIISFSCHQVKKIEEKIEMIEFYTFATYEVLEKYPQLENRDFLKGPDGSWMTLLDLSIIQNDSSLYQTCLLYKHSSQKKSSSELKFIIKTKKNCREHFFDEGIAIKNLETIWIKKSEQCHYLLTLSKDNKKWDLCLSFANLPREQKVELGHSSAQARLQQGTLLFANVSVPGPSLKKIELIGSFEDRFFSEAKPFRCHTVDDQCRTVGTNRCRYCRWGWTEVIDSNCPQGGSKFCMVDRCGEKGEPACFRGRFHEASNGKNHCQNPGLAFCQPSLVPSCRDGIVMCL